MNLVKRENKMKKGSRIMKLSTWFTQKSVMRDSQQVNKKDLRKCIREGKPPLARQRQAKLSECWSLHNLKHGRSNVDNGVVHELLAINKYITNSNLCYRIAEMPNEDK